jgi:hypothetical protein
MDSTWNYISASENCLLVKGHQYLGQLRASVVALGKAHSKPKPIF